MIDVLTPLPSPPIVGDLVIRNLAPRNALSSALIEKIELRTIPYRGASCRTDFMRRLSITPPQLTYNVGLVHLPASKICALLRLRDRRATKRSLLPRPKPAQREKSF